MKHTSNIDRLTQLKGVGKQTIDYLRILIGEATVVADSPIQEFLVQANIHTADYDDAHFVLSQAADYLGKNRRVFDYSIWRYMQKQKSNANRDFIT